MMNPTTVFVLYQYSINIQYARGPGQKVVLKLTCKGAVWNDLKFPMTATLKILQTLCQEEMWSLLNELRRSGHSSSECSYTEVKGFCCYP